MKHHSLIEDYKESLGTGRVSINAVPQVFSTSELAGSSGDRLQAEKSISDKVAKEQLSRQDLADAKKGQTVAGAMNRGIESLSAGSSILANKIEKFATKAQDIATQQMEKAQEIAVAELDLKRTRLEMAVTARQEQVSAAKVDMKSKFILECIQHIPMENREAFIKEYLGKM